MTSLAHRRIAITGRLASMTREEAAEAIREQGGTFVSSVSGKTDVLVLGQEGSPFARDGGLTTKLRRARELQDEGRAIEVLTEDAFLAALGREQEVRLYTLAQLSRLLGVSGARLRTWVRKSLVRATRTANRLAYFAFQDVATAKSVAELVEAGVAPDRIRATVAELARWLPSGGTSLEQALETFGGDLVARRDDGTLVDTRGQFRFDFECAEPAPPASAPESTVTAMREPTAQEWLERGLAAEDAGALDAAAACYERAERADPTLPEAPFNRGNACYELDDAAGAAAAFRRAVELDPGYVEAWNNLANALSETGRERDAVAAFETALRIEPLYADAHYNLAELLTSMGRHADARRHWNAYLAQDATSDWAVHARARLGK